MEASPFNILHLHPGRYSRQHIDRQYQAVRQEILRAGGPDRQRRLDDAFIAHAMLRTPSGQVALVKRVRRDVVRCSPHVPVTVADKGRTRVEPAPAADPSSSSDGGAYQRFARMVADHVESGILRFTSRRRLVLLAQGLGIAPFKANLIIAEVLHELHHGRRPAGPNVTGLEVVGTQTTRPRRYGLMLGLAVLAALAVDVFVVLWLT